MITILRPDDCDTRLRGSYDDVVALQWPCDAANMQVVRPSFPTRKRSAELTAMVSAAETDAIRNAATEFDLQICEARVRRIPCDNRKLSGWK